MKQTEITDSELNSLPKEALIILYHQMCTNQTRLLEQNETLVKKIDDLTEQIAILTQNRFGKRSEAEKQIEGQMSMSDYVDNILNEAESLTQNGTPAEKDIEVVVRTHTRKAGRRKEKLSAVEKEIVMHECSEEVLDAAFPNGWHEIGEDVYSELQYTPATFKVLEHHVKSYGGNHDGDTVIRADHPERILDHSILSPELFAMIFNMKYVNAIPLNRLSEEIRRYDVILDRQDMAGWLISVYKYYMKPVHEMMKKNLMDAGLLHCDETPFVMPERSKQYM